jgi:hypothetical protein
MFRELFTEDKNTLKLKNGNLFLNYPREIVMDIEDAIGDIIDDYQINGNNVKIIFNKNVSDKEKEKAISIIKKA